MRKGNIQPESAESGIANGGTQVDGTTSATKIISCSDGAIQTLLMAVPSVLDEERIPAVPSRFERHFRTILNCFPDRRLILLCNPAIAKQVHSWLVHANCQSADLIQAELPPQALWIQDPILVLERHGKSSQLVLNPAIAANSVWLDALEKVALSENLDLAVAPIAFSSGNILAGGRFGLIGCDTIKRIAASRTRQQTQIIDTFARLLGAEPILIGGERSSSLGLQRHLPMCGFGYQPLFHLDLYITRTGVAGSSGKEIVFLARPSSARDVLGRFAEFNAAGLDASDEVFDESEEQLAEHFEVRHLPIVFSKGRLGNSMLKQKCYAVSFNNCVMDQCRKTGKRRVILPNFSQDSFLYDTDVDARRKLELAVEHVWEDLGFDVVFSDGIEDLAYEGGGLNCMVKVISRGTRRGVAQRPEMSSTYSA